MSGPDTWGPHGWKFIHYVTLGYPSKPTNSDKIKYKNFFISLSDVIPCILCKMNYKKHLQELPINDSVLKNRQTLMAWAIKMHNLVNIENDKKPVSVSDGIKMIRKNDDTCSIENFSETKIKPNSNMKNFVTYCPMLIFGIILIYQLYLMKFKNK